MDPSTKQLRFPMAGQCARCKTPTDVDLAGMKRPPRQPALDSAEVIENAGFEVVQAANADGAIEILAARSDNHVVFTDIQMPGPIDGLKLARFVRDRWPPIKIVVDCVGDPICVLGMDTREVIPQRCAYYSQVRIGTTADQKKTVLRPRQGQAPAR